MEIPHSGLKGKSISDFKYRYIPDLPDRYERWNVSLALPGKCRNCGIQWQESVLNSLTGADYK